MSIKCAICQQAFVNGPGQVCISCKMRQRTSGSGSSEFSPSYSRPSFNMNDTNNGDNNNGRIIAESMISRDFHQQDGQQVHGYNSHVYSGIAQNVRVTQIKEPFVKRWIRSLIYGVPLSFSDEQIMFSLYSQGAYMSERVQGYEVIFYCNNGYSFLSNNSEVKVYGKTDRHGVIIADKIAGTNTSFQMRAKLSIPPLLVRILTLALIILLVWGFVGMGNASVPEMSLGSESLIVTVVMFAVAGLILKTKLRKRYIIALVLVCIGLVPISPLFLLIFIVGYLVIKIIK